MTIESLTIEKDHFVLNGGSKFLIFVSYFDGLRAMDRNPNSVRSDFQFLKAHHVDGVRVFPNWWPDCPQDGSRCSVPEFAPQDTVMTVGGALNGGRLQRLRELTQIARDEGLVVDVSFAREIPGADGHDPGEMTVGNFQTALADIASSLSDFENVIFDIQNEHDIDAPDRPSMNLALSEVVSIRNAIWSRDPSRIVTASTTTATPSQAGQFQRDAGLNVAAHHDARVSSWYNNIPAIVSEMRSVSQFHVVAYLQEPMPWQADPDAGHHLTAAYNAKHSGAAAWTFHTRSGFNLTQSSFQSKIAGSGQMSVLEGIRDTVAPNQGPARVTPLWVGTRRLVVSQARE